MEEVYRLFDRRCKTPDGLEEAPEVAAAGAAVQALGQEPGQVEEPEAGEGAGCSWTTNCWERRATRWRGRNRRFRKAQKSIYSVRTKEHLEQRLALDMNREQRAAKRAQTLKTLHHARSDPESGHS